MIIQTLIINFYGGDMKIPYLFDGLIDELGDTIYSDEEKMINNGFEKHGYKVEWLLKHLNKVSVVDAICDSSDCLIKRDYSVKGKLLFSISIVYTVDNFGNYKIETKYSDNNQEEK